MPRVIGAEELALHNTTTDCWIVVDGKVYDVTTFVESHPGGPELVTELAGMDASHDFEDVGHSAAARRQLEDYYIGDWDPSAKPSGSPAPEPPVSATAAPLAASLAEDEIVAPPLEEAKAVFFVRHSQSMYNYACNVLRGEERREYMALHPMRDAGLTEAGVQQSELTGQLFGGMWESVCEEHGIRGRVEAIISTPLSRALQTAVAFARGAGDVLRDVPIFATRRHAELAQHPCDEGTPLSELQAKWPAVTFEEGTPEEWWIPAPEDQENFERRVIDFRAWLKSRPERVFVVVGHGTFTMALSTPPHMKNGEVRLWRGKEAPEGQFIFDAVCSVEAPAAAPPQ